MAIEYSTALRNFLQNFGSKKHAFRGGVFETFAGTAPSSPDNAATGDKLVKITLASGAHTPEVLSSGTVTLSGANGQVDQITVNSVNMLAAAVVYNTDLTITAAAVALAINANLTVPDYIASSSGAVITIKALPVTGTAPNGYVVATTVSGGTLAAADVNLASGVAVVNGLLFGSSVAGALQKASGVWSGVVLITGTAGYFRITGSRVDDSLADAAPWNKIRLQGTCGTSGADYNMGTVSLVLGATHTLDAWIETLSEE